MQPQEIGRSPVAFCVARNGCRPRRNPRLHLQHSFSASAHVVAVEDSCTDRVPPHKVRRVQTVSRAMNAKTRHCCLYSISAARWFPSRVKPAMGPHLQIGASFATDSPIVSDMEMARLSRRRRHRAVAQCRSVSVTIRPGFHRSRGYFPRASHREHHRIGTVEDCVATSAPRRASAAGFSISDSTFASPCHRLAPFRRAPDDVFWDVAPLRRHIDPRSPRATISAVPTSKISSKCSSPAAFQFRTHRTSELCSAMKRLNGSHVLRVLG